MNSNKKTPDQDANPDQGRQVTQAVRPDTRLTTVFYGESAADAKADFDDSLLL